MVMAMSCGVERILQACDDPLVGEHEALRTFTAMAH